MENEKVYKMEFSKIYPLLVNKAVRKGRTKEEVDEIIRWLTGYSQKELEELTATTVGYGEFFRNAPSLNENRKLIKGVVCGVRVEEIQEPLMQEIRYLDKLVDELAKGKAMDKIKEKTERAGGSTAGIFCCGNSYPCCDRRDRGRGRLDHEFFWI